MGLGHSKYVARTTSGVRKGGAKTVLVEKLDDGAHRIAIAQDVVECTDKIDTVTPQNATTVLVSAGHVEYVRFQHDAIVLNSLHAIGANGLLACLHESFAYHRPLRLSPDHLWLTIVQGFANHVNVNSEQLRKQFVAHDDKKEIEIQRDEFVLGSKDNDWSSVIADFNKAIGGHVGQDLINVVTPTFSTTGELERVCAGVAVMDAMQSYFSYSLSTMCGMPSLTLTGTLEDWQSVVDRTEALAKYDLAWWTAQVVPLLRKFVEVKRGGKVDAGHWDSMYKWMGSRGSGGPMITGWIVRFFPYLKNYKQKLERNDFDKSMTPDSAPKSYATAPFCWKYLTRTISMQLTAGIMGMTQDASGVISPNLGFCVVQVPDPDTAVTVTTALSRDLEENSSWQARQDHRTRANELVPARKVEACIVKVRA